MPMPRNKIPSRFQHRPQRQGKRLGAATGASRRRSRTGFPVKNNLFNMDSLRRRLSTEGRGSGLGSAPLCNPKFATTGDSAPPSVPLDKIVSKDVLSLSAKKEIKKDDKFEFFKGRPFVDRNEKKKVRRNLFLNNLGRSTGRSGFDNLDLRRSLDLKKKELSSSGPENPVNRHHMVDELDLQARDEEESKLKVRNWISSQHFKENLECSLSSIPDKEILGEGSSSSNMMESHERSFVDFYRSEKASWTGFNDDRDMMAFMEEEVDILELGFKVSEVRPWQGQISVGLDNHEDSKVSLSRSELDLACGAGRDPWKDPMMQSVWDVSSPQPRFLQPRVMW